MATLAGVVATLVLSFASWRDVDRIDRSLGERLGKLETRLDQVATRLERAPAPAAQRGPDPNRVYTIQTANAPARGPAGARSPSPVLGLPVTVLLEGRSDPHADRETYPDKVRIVWKHLPLDMHKNAMGASPGVDGRQEQGKFWELHDKLFANQKELTLDAYKRYARELKLDVAQFREGPRGPREQEEGRRGQGGGDGDGRGRDARVFVNGRYLSGAKPFEEFAKVINAELGRLNVPLPPRAPTS